MRPARVPPRPPSSGPAAAQRTVWVPDGAAAGAGSGNPGSPAGRGEAELPKDLPEAERGNGHPMGPRAPRNAALGGSEAKRLDPRGRAAPSDGDAPERGAASEEQAGRRGPPSGSPPSRDPTFASRFSPGARGCKQPGSGRPPRRPLLTWRLLLAPSRGGADQSLEPRAAGRGGGSTGARTPTPRRLGGSGGRLRGARRVPAPAAAPTEIGGGRAAAAGLGPHRARARRPTAGGAPAPPPDSPRGSSKSPPRRRQQQRREHFETRASLFPPFPLCCCCCCCSILPLFGHERGCGRPLSPPGTPGAAESRGERRERMRKENSHLHFPARSDDPRAQVPSGTGARRSAPAAAAAEGPERVLRASEPAAEAGGLVPRDSGHRPRGPARGRTEPALLPRVPRGRETSDETPCFVF